MNRTAFHIKLLVAALLLTACVDKSFDLDDIDLNLSTDVDLAMPLISTSEIKLIDFLKSSNFIRTANIPGQDGEVIYAYATGSVSATIPASALKNGEVEYQAPISDIVIKDLPEFLKDKDVRFDLVNPVIIANIDSDIPEGCGALADLEVSTTKTSCLIEGIKARNGKLCQYIAMQEEKNIPAEYLSGTPELIVPTTGNISDLLSESIETLRIKVNRVSAYNVSTTPARDIHITITFTLYAPIRIGSAFCLSYTASDSDWSDEFDEDIRKMDIDMITLNADLTNNLPIEVNIEITPVDPSGKKVDGLDVIKANAKAGATSKVSYTLKSGKPGVTLHDYLNGSNGAQLLDGVSVVTRLKADASAVGKYITTKSSARFTNIELRAKGKFNYDAN